MLSLIEQWQDSGKTRQIFCQEHDLSYTTFYYWLRRYRRQVEESSFLPIEISSLSHIEIRYPGGIILSIRRQCKLVSVSRGSFYYKSLGESEDNLKLMRLMDEHYLEHPTEGVKRMRDFLLTLGILANYKRIRRLLRLI